MTKAELYKKACMLPLLPGVYIIRDKSGTIIYIGKAKRLRIRVSQYFREGVPHDNKVSQMIAHAYAFDVIVCQSEFEALVLEASQIKAHTPKYNILLKDDKGYSYIKVTKDEWPRLSFTLQKEDDGAEYIGPYTSSFAARQMAETAMDAFLLPRCSRRFPQEIGRGRPCLNAHIGKCMAVCSGKISRENYEQAVKSAVHLIRYGKKDILKTLNERMLEASDRLEFEAAALIRDQIAASISADGAVSLSGIAARYAGFLPESFRASIVEACERSISAVLNDNAVLLADVIVQKVLAPLLTPVISLVLFFVAFALLRMLVSLLVTVLGLVNKLPVIGTVNRGLGYTVGALASLVDIYLVLCVVWAIIVITGGNLTVLNDTVMSSSLYYKAFNLFNPFL